MLTHWRETAMAAYRCVKCFTCCVVITHESGVYSGRQMMLTRIRWCPACRRDIPDGETCYDTVMFEAQLDDLRKE
jgi:hypothetical protein